MFNEDAHGLIVTGLGISCTGLRILTILLSHCRRQSSEHGLRKAVICTDYSYGKKNSTISVKNSLFIRHFVIASKLENPVFKAWATIDWEKLKDIEQLELGFRLDYLDCSTAAEMEDEDASLDRYLLALHL